MILPIPHSGAWGFAAILVVVTASVLLRYLAPESWRERASAGVLPPFIVALYAEMYGLPLTIYLTLRLFGLDSAYPDTNLWVVAFGGSAIRMLISMVLGYALLLVGIALFVQGWRELHRARRQKRLATDGLYGLVRHPQYAGLLLGLFGEGVVHAPSLLSVFFFPLMVIAYSVLAGDEERRLFSKFKDQYTAYRQRVPMFIPGIGSWG